MYQWAEDPAIHSCNQSLMAVDVVVIMSSGTAPPLLGPWREAPAQSVQPHVAARSRT